MLCNISASASREEHPEVLEAGGDGWWHLEHMNPLAILDWIYYIEWTYRLLHVLRILHVPEVGPSRMMHQLLWFQFGAVFKFPALLVEFGVSIVLDRTVYKSIS